MIAQSLKKWIPTSVLGLFGGGGTTEAAAPPKLIGVSLRWIHPKLPPSPIFRIAHAATATELALAFEDYHLPSDARPYDCPMYDVVVTLHEQNGASTELKVYLPRQKIFPGLWKHPDGALYYFEVAKHQPKILVDILRPYLPAHSVYPATMTDWPPVSFNRGVPDFREVNYPIFGDFSPNEFVRGRQ